MFFIFVVTEQSLNKIQVKGKTDLFWHYLDSCYFARSVAFHGLIFYILVIWLFHFIWIFKKQLCNLQLLTFGNQLTILQLIFIVLFPRPFAPFKTFKVVYQRLFLSEGPKLKWNFCRSKLHVSTSDQISNWTIKRIDQTVCWPTVVHLFSTTYPFDETTHF